MVKKVNYQVLRSIDKVELRKYPKLLLATVTGLDENEAFNLLFNYITGSNRTQQKVEMTAPVISSQKIEMTAPVISTVSAMSFVMPEKFNINTVPTPNNPRVMIEEVQGSTIAVLRFSGHTNTNVVNRYKNELLTVLKKNNIKPTGDPFLMRYNSPFMPGFLRRNELGIKVVDKARNIK